MLCGTAQVQAPVFDFLEGDFKFRPCVHHTDGLVNVDRGPESAAFWPGVVYVRHIQREERHTDLRMRPRHVGRH